MLDDAQAAGAEAGLMSFLLPCPNCGPRDVNEFHYSGRGHEAAEAPADVP